MNFSPDNQLEVPDTTLFQELDGECVLLNLSNESYYGLNESGTRMWIVLSESHSISAACAILLREYDVEEEILRNDLYQFVDDLLQHQMVKIAVT